MRTYCVLILLATLCGPALADPQSQALKNTQTPTVHDATGRFALQSTLQQPLRKALSPDGRFAMLADLHEKQAPLPGNARYTLSSSLGDAALGTCGGSLPDPLFANGFEN